MKLTITDTQYKQLPDRLQRLFTKMYNPSSEEVRECFPETNKQAKCKTDNKSGRQTEYVGGEIHKPVERKLYLDEQNGGNASRFFKSIIYIPKASKSERNRGFDSHKLITIMGTYLSSNQDLQCIEKPDQNQIHLLDIDLSPRNEGLECEIKLSKGKDLSISLYEKLTTDQCLNECKSIIKTETDSIIVSAILNWLRLCIIREYTADVNGEIEFGENLVEDVEGGKRLTTTIKGKIEFLHDVKNAVSEMQLIIKERENKNFHSTVKPVALMEYLINMVTRDGQVVLDPFMGSGTTGVACKMLGREFIGIELDQGYYDIARKRISIYDKKTE